MSVSELARRLGVTVGTASLMVAQLTAAGLTDRQEDPDDHRRTLVSVAAAHRARVAALLRRRLQPIGTALARLHPVERAALLDGLRLVAEELRALDVVAEPAKAEPGLGRCAP